MKKCFIILAILVIYIIPAFSDDAMKFGFSEEWKPFDWQENEQCQGILVDIANEAIQKRMGISVVCYIYPWERVQHLVRENALDALISNGPLRKEWAEHSNEILIELEWKIYLKASNPKLEQIKKANSLEDLRPFQFVDYIGNGWAKANLVDKNFNIYLVSVPSKVFEVIAKGRGDINIIPAIIGRYYLKELGLKEQIVELPPVIPAIPFHLVIGKKSPFTKILPKFDQVIKQMKEDGSLQAIIDKYTK
ncbi:MAG: transporter substrate-binding domain-containing protein [Desulfobacterales bacterium]|nr:transporter substrate-binding domain-containing protein [Desulfobacterales bacterium]